MILYALVYSVTEIASFVLRDPLRASWCLGVQYEHLFYVWKYAYANYLCVWLGNLMLKGNTYCRTKPGPAPEGIWPRWLGTSRRKHECCYFSISVSGSACMSDNMVGTETNHFIVLPPWMHWVCFKNCIQQLSSLISMQFAQLQFVWTCKIRFYGSKSKNKGKTGHFSCF